MIRHRIPAITHDDLKRVKLVLKDHLSDTKVKVEIFSNNNKVASCISKSVQHGKKSGPKGRQNKGNLYFISSRMSCSEGDANIVLCSDRKIESDANSRLQLCSRDIFGEEVREKKLEDELLTQPDPKKVRRGNDHMIFTSPSIDAGNLERIKEGNLEIRLALERTRGMTEAHGEEFVYELHNSKKDGEVCFWCQKSNRDLIPLTIGRRKAAEAAIFEKPLQDETEDEGELGSCNPGEKARKKQRVFSHDSGLGVTPDHGEQSAERTNFPQDLEDLLTSNLLPIDTKDMDFEEYLLKNVHQGYSMDTDEYESEREVGQGPCMALSSGKPKSSKPVGSMSRYEAQISRPTYEAQMSRPYEFGLLDGVPRSSKPRGPMPNFGQKRAKVGNIGPLRPSTAQARSPGKEQQKSVTLRQTLLSCIFYLTKEFYEVL